MGLALLLVSSTEGWSLPPCSNTTAKSMQETQGWDNFFGNLYFETGQFKEDKYVGEFRDGRRYGQGTYIWVYEDKYVGEFRDGIAHGKGTLPRNDGNPHLFPGARFGKSLSNMALLQLMRGMGFGINGSRGDYVPHGFRSSFRDWPGEVSSFPRDVAEMALAHTIENKVEAAYWRGDLFTKRRAMMQAWANYLHKRQAGLRVLNIDKRA